MLKDVNTAVRCIYWAGFRVFRVFKDFCVPWVFKDSKDLKDFGVLRDFSYQRNRYMRSNYRSDTLVITQKRL